jgi:hypothetical protein
LRLAGWLKKNTAATSGSLSPKVLVSRLGAGRLNPIDIRGFRLRLLQHSKRSVETDEVCSTLLQC